MALPEQIRKQSEDVQKLYAEINGTEQAPNGAEAAQGDPAPAGAAPSDPPAVPPAPPATEQKPDANAYEELLQKYRSLQGTYNAQVPQLRAENKQLSTRLTQMEQLIATIQAQPPQPAAPAANGLITEKDVAEYGDSIEVMRRAARAEVQQELSELRQVVAQLQGSVVPQVQRVVERQALSSEQAFWRELAATVPDWREINADKNFHDWLLEVDPLTGLNRQTYLDDAQNQLDVQRVAAFFHQWRQVSGTAAQETRPNPVDELTRQVAPGRGRSAAPAATPNAPKTYTPQEVSKFYDDVRKGLYKGREQERGQIERDIFAAQREGRIVATA